MREWRWGSIAAFALVAVWALICRYPSSFSCGDCASLWLHDVVADGFAGLTAIERHLCFECSMGAELRGFDSLVVSGLRFIAAALLKPFAGTLVVWVARSGAKNHDR